MQICFAWNLFCFPQKYFDYTWQWKSVTEALLQIYVHYKRLIKNSHLLFFVNLWMKYNKIHSSSSPFIFKMSALFHAKLGLDVCPRVNNQHSTSVSFTIRHMSIHGYWSKCLMTGHPSCANQLQIREETMEFGNLFSDQFNFPLPYHCYCKCTTHSLSAL